MSLSGENNTFVPFFCGVFSKGKSFTTSPLVNDTFLSSPSLMDSTEKSAESAFTALVPTPFKPTDFLKALESYLPPVFILETTSFTFPRGMPLP